MTRRKLKARDGGKLIRGGNSPNPEARARALAALDEHRAAGGGPLGNRRGMTHGGRSSKAVEPFLEPLERRIFDELAGNAPLRELDELPRADRELVRQTADAILRQRNVQAYLLLHGELDEKGNVRPAVHLEQSLGGRIERNLDRLGMSPSSRVKLGLRLLEAEEAAAAMSSLEAGRRLREARREALGGDGAA
jgi:P27 family predicted phage terminase small subunit